MFMRHGSPKISNVREREEEACPQVVDFSFDALVLRIENAIRDTLNYREKIRSLEQALADREKELDKAHEQLGAIEAKRNQRDAFACSVCRAKPGINCQAGCYAAEYRCGGPTYAMRKMAEVEEFVAEHMKAFGEVVGPRHTRNTLIDSIKRCISLGNVK